MAGGLIALLDDVALIARAAAANVDDVAALAGKTSARAAGVVIDDAAVTPQYVQGVAPARELPMIWRITKGSLINKLVVILPIALILSAIAPWALSPILMCGGTYLCYEGAHKILHHFLSHEEKSQPVSHSGKQAEDSLVSSAITTDLILSAEIMVISLNSILDEGFWIRLSTLVLVAIFITFGVYGAVGLLVKMDDIGLRLLKRSKGKSMVGTALVQGMPKVLNGLTIVGTAAMLWVGGHIIIAGLHDFGASQPYGFIHWMTDSVSVGALSWSIDTVASMIFGFLIGAVVVSIIEFVKYTQRKF